MNNSNIIYFGSGSYQHLNKRNLDVLFRIRESMLNLIDKQGSCTSQEVLKDTKISPKSVSKYIFMLCAGTLELGKKPEFIMKTKLPQKHPRYKITTVIHRQGGRTI